MSTKDNCISKKSNFLSKAASNAGNHQYCNLNLNHNNNNNYDLKLHDTEIKSTYGKQRVDPDAFNFVIFHSPPQSSRPITPNNLYRQNKIKKSKKNAKRRDSTLALHIAAYENSVEAAAASDGSKAQKPSKLSKKMLKCRQILTSSTAWDSYELPRQQEENNGSNMPEVMQFKASQRLANMNEANPEAPTDSRDGIAGKINDLNISSTLTLGIFKIEKELGKGGFGTVYLGSRDGELCAIKEVDKEKHHGPFSKFSSEYLILKDLAHPHIIELLGHYELGSTVYVFLEFCSCGSFNDLLKKRNGNGLTPESTWFFFFQMVTALVYLKDHAIAHRDLKSDNIMIQSEVVLKVADFGLAKKLEKPDGKVCGNVGTFKYQAPEVKVEDMAYDAKCDIFSFGVIVAEAVTGDAPGVDILERCQDKIPAEFKFLLSKMLTIQPELRFSIEEVKSYFGKKFSRDAFKLIIAKAFEDHVAPIPDSEQIEINELSLFDNVITHGRNISATQISDDEGTASIYDRDPDLDDPPNDGSALKLSDESSRPTSMGSLANGTLFSSELADDITQESSKASIASHGGIDSSQNFTDESFRHVTAASQSSAQDENLPEDVTQKSSKASIASHGGIDSSQNFTDESFRHVTATSQSSAQDENLPEDITQEASQASEPQFPLRGKFYNLVYKGKETTLLFVSNKQYNFDRKGKVTFWRCKYAKTGKASEFQCNGRIHPNDIVKLDNGEVEITKLDKPHLESCEKEHKMPENLS